MSNIYDVIIIGAGPASLNAALYASRQDLNVLIIEKSAPGGKLLSTDKVENWIGTKLTTGFELATDFYKHALAYGANYMSGEVVNIRSNGEFDKEVMLADGNIIKGKSIIIGSGMQNRKPSTIKNFDEYFNKGISYCGICDGPIFRNQPIVVMGGGNSAVEEGTFISNVASKLYVVTIDSELKAEKKLIEELKSRSNVEIIYNATIQEVSGNGKLEKISYLDSTTNKIIELDANALFIYIGFIPKADFISDDMMIKTKSGFIITDDSMETKIPNIFAVGDIRDKKIRQIVTAASDGAIAAKVISDRISSK
ncbi:FAD-dependent oxidoreductase [Mycoplasma sp. M5725]|uniref:FAD-dependent oxidoreductase n=1 Tax=Mycoplasma phocimorsus TaxID=3045839 RepID=A0AAJ1PTL1_9MOLU|nr:FAD-dependent oxidoreductase [Mycoplasma phocimorsus]MDJ1645635.1 FAD-dependent oxidoreductase [Mycoplasma phocimorsus]